MKLKNLRFLIIVYFAIFIFSCGKSSQSKTNPAPDLDVYVAGGSYDNGTYSATYWENGIFTALSNNKNLTQANGIALVGTDVYVNGYVTNGTEYYAAYWKNGVEHDLTAPSNFSFTSNIAIRGSDVYITGTISGTSTLPIGEQIEIPVVWKNGVATTITDTTVDVQGGAIAFNGSDMYVATQTFDPTGSSPQVAELFKNNIHVPISQSDYHSSGIGGIAVQNNDIYLAGWGQKSGIDTATYWKNGNITPLPTLPGYTQAQATGIAFLGSDMYIVGFCFTENNNTNSLFTVATLWKNGLPTQLANGTQASIANAITIQGNDVYVAGTDGNGSAAYWKNGSLVELVTPSSQRTLANSIVVVPN